MTDTFLWQSAVLGWACACFFAGGARLKGLRLTRREIWRIAQATLIVLALFGLLTEGRGCAATTATADCAPDC